jgi:hypothetical protein
MRLLWLALAICGCFDPIQETTRPFKEAARAREAAQWAGTYNFSECAAANGPCWKFTVTITQAGDATVWVDGDPEPTRLNAKPWPKPDHLMLDFESYADNKNHYEWIPAGLGPAFRPSERLVALKRTPAGKFCLHFEHLESRLHTPELCMP